MTIEQRQFDNNSHYFEVHGCSLCTSTNLFSRLFFLDDLPLLVLTFGLVLWTATIFDDFLLSTLFFDNFFDFLPHSFVETVSFSFLSFFFFFFLVFELFDLYLTNKSSKELIFQDSRREMRSAWNVKVTVYSYSQSWSSFRWRMWTNWKYKGVNQH